MIHKMNAPIPRASNCSNILLILSKYYLDNLFGCSHSRFQSPDFPPDFSSKRTVSMVMPRSTALHMS